MVRARHVLHQGRVLASLAGSAARALLSSRTPVRPAPPLPGPELATRVSAPPPSLVRDYVRHLGGDPGAYRGTVPAHLFPQWTFPLAVRTLRGVPLPLSRILNAGCRLEIAAPLPAGTAFDVRARLEGIDDDGRRAVVHQRVVTGVAGGHADALTADLYLVVPARRGGAGGQETNPPEGRREGPRVPAGARELARWSLGRDEGLAFAALTGDFNPVHWVRPYARAAGFGGTILHGFATLARALEGLHRARFAGAVDRLRVVDARFVRPLVLPARVGLYLAQNPQRVPNLPRWAAAAEPPSPNTLLDGGAFFVGEAPGARAYLAATFVATGEEARGG